jgi:hypothetical protein
MSINILSPIFLKKTGKKVAEPIDDVIFGRKHPIADGFDKFIKLLDNLIRCAITSHLTYYCPIMSINLFKTKLLENPQKR